MATTGEPIPFTTDGETASRFWWLVLLQGIAAVVIGVLLLTQTGVTLYTLVVFLGVYWLIGGIFDLISLFLDRSQLGWKLLTGVIGILAGLIIVRNPLWSGIVLGTTLVWVLGIGGIIIGGLNIFRAFAGAGWGTGLVGVLSLILGVILIANPLVTVTVLVYTAAIWAIIGGIAAIAGSFWLRSTSRAAAGRTQVA
jgi:uncharacterized membrane protein HdeD (DUF308 family)